MEAVLAAQVAFAICVAAALVLQLKRAVAPVARYATAFAMTELHVWCGPVLMSEALEHRRHSLVARLYDTRAQLLPQTPRQLSRVACVVLAMNGKHDPCSTTVFFGSFVSAFLSCFQILGQICCGLTPVPLAEGTDLPGGQASRSAPALTQCAAEASGLEPVAHGVQSRDDVDATFGLTRPFGQALQALRELYELNLPVAQLSHDVE